MLKYFERVLTRKNIHKQCRITRWFGLILAAVGLILAFIPKTCGYGICLIFVGLVIFVIYLGVGAIFNPGP